MFFYAFFAYLGSQTFGKHCGVEIPRDYIVLSRVLVEKKTERMPKNKKIKKYENFTGNRIVSKI